MRTARLASWALLLSFVGCSGDDGSSSPEEVAGASAGGATAGAGAGTAGHGGSAGGTKAQDGKGGASGTSGQSGAGAPGGAGQGGAGGKGSAPQAGAGTSSGGTAQGGAGSSGDSGQGGDTAVGGAAAGGAAGQGGDAGQDGAGASGGSGQEGGAPASGGAGQGGVSSSGTSGQGGGAATGGGGSTSGAAGQGGGATGGAGSAGAGAGGQAGGTDCGGAGAPPGGTLWRSQYFPENWVPVHAGGKRDAKGRALPDFSYAGYHQGLQKPPVGQGKVVVTVAKSLGDGKVDATGAIQKAIDDTCQKGGGVVMIPAGIYRLTMQGTSEALRISCSGLVLRGQGPSTRLLLDDVANAHNRAVLRVTAGDSDLWVDEDEDGSGPDKGVATYALAKDEPETTRTIHLTSVGDLKAGDWVVIRNDNGPSFRKAHRMDKLVTNPDSGSAQQPWPAPTDTPKGDFRGLAYARRIVSISGTSITLDAPTQYALRTVDRARVYRLEASLEEVGLENFAMGMVESKGKLDSSAPPGSLNAEAQRSQLIALNSVHDAWVSNISTFQPAGNVSGAHLLSQGVALTHAAFRIHLDHTSIDYPQFLGGDGNGYAFHVSGHDNLLEDVESTAARHAITVNYGVSGNVFLRTTIHRGKAVQVLGTDGKLHGQSVLASDTHRFLSHANLFDQTTLDGVFLQSVNRGSTSSGAGFTGTRNVFWNTHVLTNHPDHFLGNGCPSKTSCCAVESAQFADGYLIGSHADPSATAGLCARSFSNVFWKTLDQGGAVDSSDPATADDFVEGENKGTTLDPPSLYEAQLAMRFTREKLGCPP